ncbi:MAG: response regulator [Symploca sp. SIO3C6]|uniref:Response regulator n=1 Tax=Symploca sp. SIO1C4 TaxID=2607765 RepID=A0A6B3NH39_9CYAN|nr:response regulator [Symploca sp. SIO3C6]NER28951.1 response regulator [Symploca sp. SIO1C4]
MKKILVIEDEPTVREAIIEMLAAENFQVISAENGRLGVELAQKEIPALIICDILMPLLNGYEVLIALRKNPHTAIIPLIFVTAKISQEDRRQGMELGADDYLTKPFTIDSLLRTVSTQLAKQDAIIKYYSSEVECYQQLDQDLHKVKHFAATREEIFQRFFEELRQSISKMNLIANMLGCTTSKAQKERYLQILKLECSHNTNLLHDVARLREIMTKDNVDILQQYNLLKGSK